jgi:predicted enzyme related to lactoylglutathione lyase
MLRGFTTVSFFADDLDAARAWYDQVFGIEPYFVREFGGTTAYLEYRVGDYQHEFGLLNSRFAPHDTTGKPAGAVIYWAVDDVAAEFDRLLALGAEVHQEPTERGPGFVTASVVDPFGNVLGIMYNQHYLDVLATSGPAT